MWLTHTMEYYSITKKNEIMPFAVTWMDLEIIILSEVKTEKDKYMINAHWKHKSELEELLKNP